MSKDATGNKLSTTEYATRKAIDVAAAIAVPVATFAAGYLVYFHGEDIAAAIKRNLNKVKNRRRK